MDSCSSIMTTRFLTVFLGEIVDDDILGWNVGWDDQNLNLKEVYFKVAFLYP